MINQQTNQNNPESEVANMPYTSKKRKNVLGWSTSANSNNIPKPKVQKRRKINGGESKEKRPPFGGGPARSIKEIKAAHA